MTEREVANGKARMMSNDDRRDIAGILARGFDEHMEVHGPDGSYAVRDGARYEVTEQDGASVARVFYQGRYYSVTVTDDGPAEIPAARRRNVIITGSTGVQYGDGSSPEQHLRRVVMRFLAWLYLAAPDWLVRLLPDSVNKSAGTFSEAVEAECNRRADKAYRRIRRDQRKAGSDAR